MLYDLGSHTLDLGDLPTIGFDRFRFTTSGLDPPHHRPGGGVIGVIDDRDSRTLGAVANSDCFAYTLRSARDDGHFALEPHVRSLRRLCDAASPRRRTSACV